MAGRTYMVARPPGCSIGKQHRSALGVLPDINVISFRTERLNRHKAHGRELQTPLLLSGTLDTTPLVKARTRADQLLLV